MPTCQAYKCTNTTGRTTKGKSFFKITEPKIATKREIAQQWLHKMGMGQGIKTFKFSRNSVLCEEHFHKDCFIIKKKLLSTYIDICAIKNLLLIFRSKDASRCLRHKIRN